MEATQIVSLGLLGQWYSARHDLGQYRSDGMTAVCRFDPVGIARPWTWFANVLEHAVQETIRSNAGLGFGITEPLEGGKTAFQRLESIDRDVIEYVEEKQQIADEALCARVGRSHDRLWQANKPAWRLMVLRYGDWDITAPRDGPLRIDISVFSHHAIADGLSIVAFQRQLLRNFEKASTLGETACSWPLPISQDQHVPTTIDFLFDFYSSSPQSSASSTPNDLEIWGAKDIQAQDDTSFETHIHIVTVPEQDLYQILTRCKESGITLTSLIYSLVNASISRNVEDAQALRGVIPYSLRRFSPISKDAIINHISYFDSDVDSFKLDSIRRTTPGSAEEWAVLATLARDVKEQMSNEMSRFPGDCVLAKIAQIPDFYQHCRSQFGQKRTSTYELSNVGILDATGIPKSHLDIERLVFTQSGMVAGPCLGFNCATLMEGPLSITVTWLKGIVEDEVVLRIARELEERLRSLGDSYSQ